MFVHEEAFPLFPTMMNVEVVPDAAALNQALIAAAAPLLRGNRPQRQTLPDLHRRPEFGVLVEAIQSAADRALEELSYRHQGLAMGALWATAAPGGMAEPQLTSPNAFFAAVYVAAATPGSLLLCTDPRPQAQVLQPQVTQRNEMNAREVTLPLVPGRLMVFPGWLPHGVVPQAPGGDRLVFRATLQFRNFAEAISPPMWQGLTQPLGEER